MLLPCPFMLLGLACPSAKSILRQHGQCQWQVSVSERLILTLLTARYSLTNIAPARSGPSFQCNMAPMKGHRKPYKLMKQRERWTDEEHQRFLEAVSRLVQDGALASVVFVSPCSFDVLKPVACAGMAVTGRT